MCRHRGFLSCYLNGPLPYVRHHITVNTNVLSASLNKKTKTKQNIISLSSPEDIERFRQEMSKRGPTGVVHKSEAKITEITDDKADTADRCVHTDKTQTETSVKTDDLQIKLDNRPPTPLVNGDAGHKASTLTEVAVSDG